MKTLEGLPLTVFIPGRVNQVNLGRIHEDWGRISTDSLDPWGGQLTVNLGRICKDCGKITSDNVDPGGNRSIDSQLGKMHEDFGRITSDSVHPGARGVN